MHQMFSLHCGKNGIPFDDIWGATTGPQHFYKKHAHDDEGRHCVICCVADICTGYCLDHRWYSSKFASGAIWTCKCVAQNLHRVCHGVHKGHSLEPAQPIKGIHAVYLELMLNSDRKLHRIFYGICTNVATNALSVFV